MDDMMYRSGMQRPYMGGLYKVNGIDGANMFQMMANSCVALFDANSDVFFLKITDAVGNPSIRKFGFSEIIDPPSGDSFITRDEVSEMFNELKGLILNGKYNIPEQSNATTANVERVQDGAKSNTVSNKYDKGKSRDGKYNE